MKILISILLALIFLASLINCQSCSTACSTILGTSASSSSSGSITATCSYINCSVQSFNVNYCMRCTTNTGYLSDSCTKITCKASGLFKSSNFIYAVLTSMAFIFINQHIL